MKLLLLNVVLITIFNKDVCGADPRIVGGQPAVKGQFPCQASIRMKSTDFPFCGGCVIDDIHVLTAAHCVFETSNDEDYCVISPSRLVIKAGGINDLQLKPFDVKYIFTHPDYNPSQIDTDGDIAMIRIKGNFSENPDIQPIDLSSEQIPEGTKCTVSGWGTTSFEGPTSPNLLYTTVRIENQQVCEDTYNLLEIYISDRMICAGDLIEAHDSCQGDSGGPLICNDELSGIVSFGIGCGNPVYPGIYTNVSSYGYWIEDTKLRSSASNVFNRFYLSVVLFALTSLGLF